MTRAFLPLLITLLVAACGPSTDDYSDPVGGPDRLVIYSTTDTAVFKPVIEDFRTRNPQIEVRYVEMDAGPLYARFLQESAMRKPQADLLLSSAMDLQVKLANDGHAATHRSDNVRRLPSWARWREEAFGFTFEPAVIVVNKTLIKSAAIPNSRPKLVRALAEDSGFWRGRIGTYNIETSNVGYLLASQDARQSNDFAAMVALFRAVNIRTYDRTSGVLDALERGEIVLGYNLLGSYAQARIAAGAQLAIVYPEDYTLAVARTAIVPRNAVHPRAAHLFLEYLLSLRGQRTLTSRSRLSAARQEIEGPYSRLGIAEATVGPLRPISLGPGLLVYLDQQKRRRLLETWSGTPR